MIKEYRSRWGMYTTDITIDGVRKHIVFTGLRDGGSYFTTTDEKEASALENKSDFDSDYYLYRDEKENKTESLKPKVISEKPEVKTVEDVANITQAREYLKKEGIDHRKLMTPAAILKQAEGLGVEFPNLVV